MKQLKKISLLFLFILGVSGLQAKDTPITLHELPQNAQSFLKKYFPSSKTSYIIKDKDYFSTDYEVRLENGTEIEFDEKGNWTEVDGKHRSIPTAFIPAKIMNYLKEKFPNTTISKIEKGSKKYEVELNGDIDLEFNLNGDFLKID